VLSTYASYQLIAKDMPKALDRIEKQPLVDRETDYYLENIGKVTSIEAFVKDDRLFRYAMKAHGLEDMTYAKAFMVKALKEGLSSPESFANKLTDKRYAEFVRTFDFAARGEIATIYNKAQHDVPKNYAIQAQIAGLDPSSAYVQGETTFYLANVGKIKSIDEFLANDRVLTFAMAAYGLDSVTEDMDFIRELLEGGTREPDSPANKQTDKRYTAFVAAFDFEAHGETATTYSLAQRPAIDRYMRQTLEEKAGDDNEGVRLALYFERKAGGITSFYDVLADPALAKVVRTALSLPDSFASADIDRQVKLFEEKFDIADFSDPEKLGEFLTRFTSLWEIQNPSASAQTQLSVLFSQPVEFGISTSTLLAIQTMKR
jgi:hypothetical protein